MPVEKIRLQKYLAEAGVASRRKSEELIACGKVKVNGHVADLGDKVDPKLDIVTVSGKRIQKETGEQIYIVLNKPRGFVTTMHDEMGRKCVAELVKGVKERVYPVGRLDRNSEGLLIMTNDGRFANMMTHPSKHVPKTYRVTVHSKVTQEKLDKMAAGMVIDGYKTAPAEVEVILDEPGRTVLQITIFEGRNRQIRKMCEQLNLDVARLKRISVGTVKLGMLAPGKWRYLDTREVRQLYAAASEKAVNSRRK